MLPFSANMKRAMGLVDAQMLSTPLRMILWLFCKQSWEEQQRMPSWTLFHPMEGSIKNQTSFPHAALAAFLEYINVCHTLHLQFGTHQYLPYTQFPQYNDLMGPLIVRTRAQKVANYMGSLSIMFCSLINSSRSLPRRMTNLLCPSHITPQDSFQTLKICYF